jgi:protein-disulfide isomerase
MPTLAADDWLADELLTQLNDIRRSMKVLNEEIQQLRREVEILKVKTKDPREDVAKAMLQLGKGKSLGNQDAPVVIFEFTDYQCPFCARHNKETLGEIKHTYVDSGNVRYFIGDYPLGFHKEAKNASIAAVCAGQQGAYWKMHHKLFNNQRELKQGIYEEYAKEFGLDTNEFSKCMANPEHQNQINQEIALAEKAGVKGTPAFLIGRLKNGQVTDIQFLSGAQPFARFSKVIERLLPPEERQAIEVIQNNAKQG